MAIVVRCSTAHKYHGILYAIPTLEHARGDYVAARIAVQTFSVFHHEPVQVNAVSRGVVDSAQHVSVLSQSVATGASCSLPVSHFTSAATFKLLPSCHQTFAVPTEFFH